MEELKTPKNVRQIGRPEGGTLIYIEDYVITFARKQARKQTEPQLAVLLGKETEGTDKPLFISGAVLVENFPLQTTLLLSNENWTQIYEEIKKHFAELEILGCLIIQAEEAGLTENLARLCRENFKSGRVLFLYDREEQEESFYQIENGRWQKKEGYYIYYEKNDAMQAYMVERSEGTSEEVLFDDQAMRRVRQTFSVKTEQREVEEKKLLQLMYGVSTVLAAAVLVIGVTMLDGHDKMRNMEYTLNTISDKVAQETEEPENSKNSESSKSADSTKSAESSATTEASKNAAASTEEASQEVVVETLNGNTEMSGSGEMSNNTEKNSNEEVSSNTEVNGTVEVSSNEEMKEALEKADEKKGEAEKTEPEKEKSGEKKPVQEAAVTQERKKVTYYTVKEGDTLASISLKKYKTLDKVEEIQELNAIDDKDKIFAGEKILLP